MQEEDLKTEEISNCAKSDARNLLHKTTKPNKLWKINLVLFYLIICEETKGGRENPKRKIKIK